jgi:Sulfotransferase family
MYPDFLGIGAQKAGTTWLHRSLQVHPQIWMPSLKEIHYFDEKARFRGGLPSRLFGHRPVDMRWRRQFKARIKRPPKKLTWQDVSWDLRYFFARPSDEWYASLFERGRGKTTGEMTPDYSMLDKDGVAHVHEIMPQAKIIFMMRSPIERPWSVIDMGLRITGRSRNEVSDRKFYRQFNNRRLALMTNYRRTLENWGSFYPEEQIFVGFLEDIHFFPEDLLRRLYEFLEVDLSKKYRVIRRKIHSGSQDTMPTRFAVYLARSYHKPLKVLHERFGGYASFWLYCAERLIEDPPEDEVITYPLYESKMWEEWAGSRRIAIQSGPLSAVGTAS